MSILTWIILVTIINGFLALVGAVTFVFSKKVLNKILLFLVAFATGALLGGALFHLIPESLEEIKAYTTILLIIAGFTIFYLIEKILHWHHCHKGECHIHTVNYLILIGDGVHNFVDGLIIAASFLISIPIGITTSILILLHELPQEIGDFGVLVYGGFSKTKALFYNFLSQATAIIGGIIGFYFLQANAYAIYLLPFAAGGFLYIAIMDLIPEIFKESNRVKLTSNLLGILLGLLVLISSKFLLG